MGVKLTLFLCFCLLFSHFVLLVIDAGFYHVHQLISIHLAYAHAKEIIMLISWVHLNQLVK